MSVLVFGGNGQVGQELLRALAGQGPVIATTRSGQLPDGSGCERADFDQPQTLGEVLDRLRPTAVVNAAAYTAVDRAEQDAEAAHRANAEAPAAIAAWCAAHDTPLVHYSTDYVFDGQGTQPYPEDAPTAPLGVYGATKLAGEEAIRASGAPHLIFRTAWVYAAHGHNFLRTMLRVGADRDELRVVADQVGTPTPAALIADVTAHVLAQRATLPSGTWHLTATGETTWHGFAEAIFAEAAAAGLLPRAPRVLPITTAEYPTPARRPAYSRLDVSRLQRDFALELPQWRDGLHQVVGTLAAAAPAA
ncbi:dTDP-4-dehydrorhamnose reductase [Xanthomonas sacchari]|uniref:dTDP-4-dehydrorhamnose reductase n=1 Tax=Xanthomonas sacchari TaxID=56458 RepID=A0A2P5Z2L7_9XANT|nr:dTDP-4-dehydrorhamnose reductase [Xanthomonas sacchari]MDV0438956.1 dTDP-4-dehydrorhamnose reductase [Xanthomonas sacchari]PPU81878.1 dTDP-4-dehydrorhamnose reductase [Xanthomonas sacchari]